MAGQARIGISGWNYVPWRKVFYPAGLPQRLELEFASQAFNSIEINGSFYSLQKPGSYREWFARTPDDFVFSVKGGQYITHMRRLRNVQIPLANFFASGVLELKQKLGPILWQFPPNFKFAADVFRTFLKLLPRDTVAAARLAKKHDGKSAEVATEAHGRRPLRYALEIRHESFKDPKFIELLRRFNVAWVMAETAGKWPYSEDITADFIYVRLHGDTELYVSGYTPEKLDYWATRLRAWRNGEPSPPGPLIHVQTPAPEMPRDVYCYFDNDVKVKSPEDARGLAQRLGIERTVDPALSKIKKTVKPKGKP